MVGIHSSSLRITRPSPHRQRSLERQRPNRKPVGSTLYNPLSVMAAFTDSVMLALETTRERRSAGGAGEDREADLEDHTGRRAGAEGV